ncbi:hypothetical protein FJQ54_16870 [Sandaracinobacter neustonicus]|uniref:Uncharacterized protein n=1 Tax=Sandaracinobacter neustonicus TaxID=1715348 RepID=A0A501XEG4_9SPHN|nr:hypothetical protein [Sandaracinobacter neustonicus]TPE58717.1 hypothetical protein FJQ54_16870 [Sandaracinobacter neustonicus]
MITDERTLTTDEIAQLQSDGSTWAASIWNRPDWLKAALVAGEPFSDVLQVLSLLPVYDHPDIDSFMHMGLVDLVIAEFDAKCIGRHIHFYAPNKPGVQVPMPATPAGAMKTHWDMWLKSFYDPVGGRQRITVRIYLNDPLLRFLWNPGFPITVKTPQGQTLISNPRFDQLGGRWVSVEFLYEPGNTDFDQMADFNIALIVDDKLHEGYCLPIIIDPRWGN